MSKTGVMPSYFNAHGACARHDGLYRLSVNRNGYFASYRYAARPSVNGFSTA